MRVPWLQSREVKERENNYPQNEFGSPVDSRELLSARIKRSLIYAAGGILLLSATNQEGGGKGKEKKGGKKGSIC